MRLRGVMAASPRLSSWSVGSGPYMHMAAVGGGLVCLLTRLAERDFGKPKCCNMKGLVLSKSFCGLDVWLAPLKCISIASAWLCLVYNHDYR